MALYSRLLRSVAGLFVAAMVSACSDSVAGTPAVPIGGALWSVTSGATASAQALQVLRFYPQQITVNAGDEIQWAFPAGEPHTVTLLGPRATPPPVDDPTNSVPVGPSTYDGSTYVSSGFKLLGQNYALTLTKPGTYIYQCLIHPGMQGTITVQPGGSKHPVNQAAYLAQTNAQTAADLASAASAVSAFPFQTGGPQIAAGLTPGALTGPPSDLTILRFLDGPSLTDTSVTIAAGQTVTWTNESNNEPHTVTLAPVGVPFPTLNPFGPASGGSIYDGTTLVNSGVLAPGQSFAVQFTKPGTYTYHCLFHDDTENMIGTVIVQ